MSMYNSRLERTLNTITNNQILIFVRSQFLDHYEVWLFIVAFGIAILLGLGTPFHYNGDSEQYLKMAWYLLGDGRGEYFYYRTPGFPLFLIVTGVASFESFWGLIAVHIVMAALIPVLVYRTFFHLNSSFAKIAATVILLSGYPFLYMSKVMTDHGAIFLQFWALLLVSKFLQTCTRRDIIGLTLLLFFLALLRPAAGLMVFPVWLVFSLIKPVPWKHIFLSIIIFISLSLGHSVIRAKILNPPEQWGHTATVGITPGSGMFGHMFFWNMYSTARAFCSGDLVVFEENGPKTARLFREFRRYLQRQPAFLAYLPQATDTETFIQDIFINTGPFKHSVLWLAMDNSLGPVKADKIMGEAAVESMLNRPSTVYFAWDGIVQFFFGYDIDYNDGRNPGNPLILARSIRPGDYQGTKFNSSFVSERMLREQGRPIIDLRRYYEPIWNVIAFWMFILKISAVFIGAVLAPFWWKTNVQNFMLLSVLIVCYQAVICVLAWTPHIRYIDPVVPLMLIVAAAGVFYYFQDRKIRNVIGTEKERL